MITPPIEPMLAKPWGSSVPEDTAGLSFEPKWDGFRCLVFRSPDGVVLQGRGRSRTSADDVIDLAYAFLNYLLEPTVAAKNIAFTHFLFPNKEAYALLSDDLRNSPVLFPPQTVLDKSETVHDLGNANRLYIEAWDKIKAGS